MCDIWANWLLPKVLKSCPKSNKSPNLVTLPVAPVFEAIVAKIGETKSCKFLIFWGQDYLSVPTGSTNGIRGGVILTLDTEAFDYAYNARASSGFRIALVDPRDKPIMNQNSILISPGLSLSRSQRHYFLIGKLICLHNYSTTKLCV